ncbi:L-alanine exporter AlaE [Pararhizobium mangrovi]|uniref:L-alanine exporter AlaE n=1 Tax=Pararhizobium mangrovi TaxID=2590452 RepID=A0A506UHC9_9HYPH|nr:L-alanine exporter AlaE [Pararhizobium mangrovi]TPW32712.1 L-alanine exporter AlaE [Pararhizobium mangrovi]
MAGATATKLSHRTRSFIADTLALVVFFTITSGLNERFIAGMSWNEVLSSRMIGAPLMVVTARPYGLWRDWLLAKVDPAGRIGELVTDAAALLAFQVPIYAGIIFAGGARGMGIVTGVAGFAALMLILGRPYGVWLEFVRHHFGLSGSGQKPMSLGG